MAVARALPAPVLGVLVLWPLAIVELVGAVANQAAMFIEINMLGKKIQNELLVARIDGALRAIAPDLITLLDEQTGEAIHTERLKYGQRVVAIAIPCPPVWRTEAGLRGSLENDSLTEDEIQQIEDDRARAEAAAALREDDYQLAYAIDILKGLNALGPLATSGQ